MCTRALPLPDLSLQVGLSEGEQELLDVLRAQTVDAASVDGPAQELVHLVLRVQVFLRVPENEMPGKNKDEKSQDEILTSSTQAAVRKKCE